MKFEDYKGYKIDIQYDGMFIAYRTEKNEDGIEISREDTLIKADTLKNLKTVIDGELKTTIRKPAIMQDRWSLCDFTDVTITSARKVKYGWDVWVSWKDEYGSNRREKTDFGQLIKPTKRNKMIVKEVDEVNRQVKELSKKRDGLIEQLIYYTPKDFGFECEVK